MILYALAALSLAAQSPAEPAPAESPAMAAARENLARVKTRAAFKSGPEAEFSEAARAAGEFGKVVVVGVIGPDGRFGDLSVADSSRSARLDAAALAAAAETLFEPARDAAGEPLAVRARMPFDFSNAKSPGQGGGALRYRCDQFARDYDWWFRTWPSDQHDDFYLLVLGMTTLARLQGASGADLSKFGAVNKDFDVRLEGGRRRLSRQAQQDVHRRLQAGRRPVEAHGRRLAAPFPPSVHAGMDRLQAARVRRSAAMSARRRLARPWTGADVFAARKARTTS